MMLLVSYTIAKFAKFFFNLGLKLRSNEVKYIHHKMQLMKKVQSTMIQLSKEKDNLEKWIARCQELSGTPK